MNDQHITRTNVSQKETIGGLSNAGYDKFDNNATERSKYLISNIMKKQLLVLIVLFFAISQAWAATLTVGTTGTYTTLNAALSAAVSGDEIHIISSGSYGGFTYSSAGNLTIKNMSAGTVTIQGASPALTVTGGVLTMNGITFVTSTNDPAILIQGGKLIIRSCTVIESASFNQSGVLLTGGELDAGLSTDPGHNTFTVNGPGKAVNNTGGVANAVENFWGGTDFIFVTSRIAGTVAYDPWCNSTFTQCNFTTQGGPITTAPGIVACSPLIDIPITTDIFDDIDAISLTLTYDPAVLTYNNVFTGHASLSGGFWNVNSPAPGVLKIGWISMTGVTIPTPPTPIQIVSVQFNYAGGFTNLVWDDSDPIFCEYQHALIQGPYYDQPTSTYYINGWVTELAAAIPGPNVSECQQIPTQTLTATATPVAPGTSIVWYDSQTGGNVVTPTLSAPGTVTYWAANATSNCESVTRVPVTLHMDPKNIATIHYDNGNGQPYFCTNGTVANVIQTGTPGGIYSVQPSTGLVINQNAGQVNIAASTAGTYTVVYTMQAVGLCPADAVTTQFVLTQLPTITTYQYDDNPFCFDAPNALPTLVASNTNGVYSIPNPPFGLLFNNATGELYLQGQSPANTYNMVYTIPAAMGCPDVTKATSVTVRPEFTLATSSTNETCDGALDGTATVIPTNGVAPLSYLWNDPAAQTTATATGLAHGTYSVTVTDANMPNACVQTATVTVGLEPLPVPAIAPMADISTITKTPVIIHSQVTYPTFTIPAGYKADALITSATPFPVGAKVSKVIYQEGSNVVTLTPNFSLDNLSSVYLSDILGTPPTPLAPHSGLTIDWDIYIEGFNAPATYAVTLQTVTYIDKSICVAPIGNAESFNLTFADLVSVSIYPDPAQIMCDEVQFGFNIQYPAIVNIDNNTGLIKNNAIITSNVPLPAATLNWSYNGNPGAPYTVTTGTTQLYLSAITGITAPLEGHGNLNDTWSFTLTGPGIDASDYIFTIDNVAQLGGDYVYNTSTINLLGLPVVSTSQVADIAAITNTPVIIHETVTYPSVISALPTVLTDALITSSVAFPTNAVIESITYNQGSGTTQFNVNYPIGGLTQVFLSDILGSASPLNGHAGLTVNWTFTISGFDAPQTYGIVFTPIAYINKAVCYDIIGSSQSFNLTFADLVSFAISPNPAQIICDEVQFGFNIQYPAIQNIDNNTGVIKNNAVITSNVPMPASTLNWSYNGNPGAPYSVTPGTTQIYLSDVTGMTAPMQGHGNLNDTWMFTLTGTNLAANDYTFTIENVAQLSGDYIYNTSTLNLIGLPVVTLAPIADISTITKTPVIVPATVTYPAVITAQSSVLTDAVLTTSVPFPAGVVIESVTYDQGSGTTVFPVNFTGFNGSQTSFYLSDILGTAANPLNGHAGLTVNWTFTISGFQAPYTGVVTVTPVAYQSKGFCESVIGNAESFTLTFADLISYTVVPTSPIAGCNNQVDFTITIVNPAVVNVPNSVTTDALITSNIPLPAGTVIGWSYNGSPVSNHTLAAPTSSLYLSSLVGTSYPIVFENLVTAVWDFTVTVPNTAVASYDLIVESMAKLGTSEYVYYTENITLNFAPTPLVTAMDLQAKLGPTGNWYPVSGSMPNYDLCLDPANAPTDYIVDIASLTSNIPLEQNFYNPFYLPANPSAALLSYWAAKGVVSGATGWQGQMWQIINGLQPMVYILYNGTSYQLVDGLMYSLYGGTPPMTIPADYPEDVYTLTGQVKEAFIGCLSAPFSINLSLNTVPLLTITGTDVTCFGANDGKIDLTVVGTHTPFSFNWSGPTPVGNIQNPTNLAPGTYYVQVTDAKGCYSYTSQMINEPAELLITGITSPVYNGGFNISCNGLSDGSIDLTVQGGTTPYSYAWTGPVPILSIEDPASIPAGTYTVVVTDANGCSATTSITLTQPMPLVAAINQYNNISCFGFNDGTATVSVTGGYAAVDYQYAWSPSGQTTATAINLAPVTHTVVVTDDNGCSTTAQITLTEPAEVLPPTNPGHLTVCGSLPVTQTITATATVPAGHYIVWYDQATGGNVVQNPDLSTVGSVTYYAEAVNSTTNCSSLSRTAVNLQIDQPASAIITYLDNPYCSNEAFAYVTRTGTPGGFPGGTPGGTYFAYQPGISINPSTGTIDIGASIPAMYTIGYVMPANGVCPSTITTTSIIIEQIPIATISYNTPFCHNGGVESPTIVGTQGGLFSYYSYPNLALNTITGDITLGGASLPGTYTVFYSFAATLACPQVNTSTTVQVLDQVSVSVTGVTGETCFGTSDGTISLAISGFVPPVTFNWSGPTTIGNTIQNPIGLSQGVYNVTVTDAFGCSATATATVNGVGQLTATVSTVDVSCAGYNDGSISITGAAGGYGTFEYSINGGGSWQSSGIYTGLIAGVYDVWMRDGAYPSCFVDLDGTLNTPISEPLPVSATFTFTDIDCYGANDGTITIVGATGGYGTFEYSVDGGSYWQSLNMFTNLAPGQYSVLVRDAQFINCVTSLGSVAISQPGMLSATVMTTDVTCYNNSDGVIALYNPTGGAGTYEFSIDGGMTWQANPFFTGLPNGTYDVWIKDPAAVSCTIDLDGSANTVITQPAQLSATVASGNATCNGANDGYIMISGAMGGYGTYEYSIDGGVNWFTSGSFTGLAPSTYNVQIRDAVYTYCIEILDANLIITQPPALAGSMIATNVSCYGYNDGSILISGVSGGSGSFEFTLDGGQNWVTGNQPGGHLFANLAPGIYDVQMRDMVNVYCILDFDGVTNTTISEPGILQGMISSPAIYNGYNVSCNGAADGSVSVFVSGGTMPYNYSWSGPTPIGNSFSGNNIAAGTYSVTVTDANSCSTTLSVTLSEPPAINVSGVSTDVTCPGYADGTIDLTVTGGTGQMSFVWSGPTTIGNVEDPVNLSAGTYFVTVTDANLCSATFNITVGTTPDLTPPSFNCPADITQGADFGQCAATLSIVIPVAYDNCDPNPMVTGVRSDALALTAPFPVGVTIITWTAMDANGQSSTCNQTISIFDNQPPVITCPPTVNTLYTAGACNALVNIGVPQVTDNCGVSSVIGVRSDALPLSAPFESGQTFVTWTATDINNNQQTCIQEVNVTPTELLMLYNFNYASQYPILPNYIAPAMAGYCTSFEPFLLTNTGTATGPLAFISDLNLIGNNGLAMAQSNGTNARYFEFRVYGDSLYKYRDYQLYLQGRRQVQAATQIALYYSFDGVNFWPGDSMQMTSADTWFEKIFDLTGHDTINYTKNLYLRLYVRGSNVSVGNTRLDIDNFQLTAINGPIARPDFSLVQANGTVVINVLANDDYGCSGQASILPIIGVDVASHGTSTMNPNGTFTYVPDPNFLGNDFFTYRICDGIGNCDTAIVRVTVITPDLYLAPRVFLQGAYDTASGLMNDQLRTLSYLPTSQPYSSAPYSSKFTHIGSGSEVTTPAVLAVTGPDAIVDWVFIELRDKNNNANVVATRAALVQRDGDVVDVDGVSPVKFANLIGTEYYVAVRHRNHLGVMSANTVFLSLTGTVVDFTNGTVPEFNFGIQNGYNYTTLAQKTLKPGIRGLHTGNALPDKKVKYQGTGNDRSAILSQVLTHPGNTLFEMNYNFATGYYSGDINMDGQVKYMGAGNDSSVLLNAVLNYIPGATLIFDFMIEQIP